MLPFKFLIAIQVRKFRGEEKERMRGVCILLISRRIQIYPEFYKKNLVFIWAEPIYLETLEMKHTGTK